MIGEDDRRVRVSKEKDMNQSVLHTAHGLRKTRLLAWKERYLQEGGKEQKREESTSACSALAAQCILIIDDSMTIRTIVTAMLAQEGYMVRAFADGIEAMKWLTEPESPTPDLILVDLGLPKMDGYEVIRAIKKKSRFAQTRFVMLSRCDGVIERLKGRLAGAMTYLPKPFTVQTLLSTVQAALSREAESEKLELSHRL